MSHDVTLNCSNDAHPPPNFTFIVSRKTVDNVTVLMNKTSNDSVLKLDETNIAPLFFQDTESLLVLCRVFNEFGSDDGTTRITVCGRI